MRRICAWCGLPMGVKEPLDEDESTHGICLTCGGALFIVLGSAEDEKTERKPLSDGRDSGSLPTVRTPGPGDRKRVPQPWKGDSG